MQQPSVTPSTDTEPADQYSKRRCTAIWCTVALHALSVIILLIGLMAATRTGNVAVSGYYSGIILSFGTFLGIVGLNVVENRRPMLVAAIIFISLGVVSCFFCAIVDGIIAAEYIDRRPLMEGRCEFYASNTGYAYENYYNEVSIKSAGRKIHNVPPNPSNLVSLVVCQNYNQDCKLKVKANTCYCCDLYNCESPGYHTHYFEFTGVNSCWDVVHLHRLLWSDVVLNVLGVFLGIITAAILGAFKDLVPAVRSQMSPRPAPPPHILYNPTQHVVTYAGFCPSAQALPAYPNYPVPMQHLNNFPGGNSAQPSPDVPVTPSEENQPPSQPSNTNPSVPSQSTCPDTSGYMLTPNAPSLYPHSLGPFEKPPPYAC
ncbi:transmembrane protein 255B isoform X1 [Clarias gariepinus]|uniref:transmembrane protein 255B isoform X1 n=1 Tax=Clarias gariepinus TaxID=13013 RepID=UPI00234CF7D6|nr:transmembrane protein 255B isoform X1 [Clarias gariepinus]